MLTFASMLTAIQQGHVRPHYFGESSYVPSPGYRGKRSSEARQVKRVYMFDGKQLPLPNVTRDKEGRILALVMSTGKLKAVKLIRLP